MEQQSIFDYMYQPFKIDKPIRLISLFSGYDSQAMALKRLGADFEHYRAVEFDKYAIASLNAIHGTDFPVTDIKDIKGIDLGIMNKDKYCYLMTYSFPCGLPGTKIKTEYGYKNIENVELGDKVLTHNNRYQKIVKVMNRICPDYYLIRVLGCPELKLTSEHPLYVLRNGQIEWVKVKDLSVTDKVCFNVNTENIPTMCSDKVLWLLGRYVADGHINKYTYNSVNFAVAFKKEKEFIENIPDEMQGHFKKVKKSCWDYRIADSDFQELCAECGMGAVNKRVPQWVLDLPVEQAKHFLDGYMSGDGHIRSDRKKQVAMFSTTSKELYLGLQMLIAKIYGVVCSCYKRADNRKETFNDTYNCQFSPNGKTASQVRIGEQIFTPIREITHINAETPVYNFEVENDNSYTCENIVVHNCTDISRAGEQKGLAEGSGTRSSLLWEVKRILNELKDTDRLPQVLLMENVAALMDEQNRPHYRKWLNFLEDIGYTTYSEILNTYDYGLPQNRERVFAISLLGQYNYKFPHAISLEHCMEDFYEELTEEQAMRYVMKTDAAHDLLVELKENGTLEQENKRVG